MNKHVEQHLTVRQVAELLHYSTKWVYLRVDDGQFWPVFKHNGQIRIPHSTVIAWMKKNNELNR